MKYFIVALMMTILSLYAALDHQITRVHSLENQAAIMKNTISRQYLSINKLEDYRISLKPPRILVYGWPVEVSEYDNVSSYYGERNDPLRRNTGGNNNPFHNGTDITGIPGARVKAVAAGIVEIKYYEKGWHDGIYYSGHKYYNGYVVIKHDDGMKSEYIHVGEILVHEGQRVEAGQKIAQISEQEWLYSTGPHLDFRLQNKNGKYVNPLLFIGLK
ncbi:M23 family metallopeptidase [Candidatus Pacearchaeota archaeon]|nr:M23 family metallopeptidase [Candidatus Pacearchaeota archaeon]